jgi:DinB superfamily
MTDLLPLLFTGYDEAWSRLDQRLTGLTQDEYLWEPAKPGWTVRDGQADWTDPEPVPAPIPTIAWRLWHIAATCLDSYLAISPDGCPLTVKGLQWHDDVDTALRDLRTAAEAFRTQMTAMGEDGIRTKLGPAWGPFAEATHAALVIHAHDELAHHGAEISLLRDLYRARQN